MVRLSSLIVAFTLLAACKKDDQQPVAQPVQPVGAGPQTTAPPGPQPGAPGTAVPGQMAVPGPSALACTSDAQCLTHHCNMQYQKCAFPCQSDVDCIQGTTCLVSGGALAACVPKPPGQ
jgi:hypothetical protein